jgi:type 1 glutamine amidotransferase
MRLLCLALVTLIAAGAAADFPPPDKLPAHKDLPDPLVMLNGAKVKSKEEWVKKRRPELKQLFQHYMYGFLPPAPAKVEAKIEHEDTKALDGKAILREVSLSVAAAPAPKIRLLLVIPAKRKGPAPVFVGMNFTGNHTLVDDPKVNIPTSWMYPFGPGVKNNQASAAGRGKSKDVWAIDQTIERGYAVCTFYNGDVDPDQKESRGPLKVAVDREGKAGTIAAWAWGIHRAVDYLVGLPELDKKKIIVVGHSRLGKTALLAAAFDERIALAIPHQAGCGGTAPSRDWIGGLPAGKVETVKRINTSFPHWFNAEFKKFNDAPERLPFDQNALAALVAPRPVLFSNAQKDVWANPPGQLEVLKATESVYKLLGAGGLASREMPREGELSDGTLGYYIRAGIHSMTRGDWKVFLDFADKHLGKPATTASAKGRKKLLLVGQGPDGHPPRTHEYMAGLRVLAALLKPVRELEVTTVRADGKWAEGPELIDRSDGVVLFLAEGAKWVGQDAKRLAALKGLQARGGGLATLHWAMGAREAGPVRDYVDLFGGCHGGPDRKYKVLQTTARPGKHEATSGLADFKVKDEFYYRLKFAPAGDGAKGVLEPLLRVKIDEEEYTVAWAYRPLRGGRAFGFSGLHYHDNWKRPEYRRLVAQGVLWSLGLPVPEKGLDVTIDEKVLQLP